MASLGLVPASPTFFPSMSPAVHPVLQRGILLGFRLQLYLVHSQEQPPCGSILLRQSDPHWTLGSAYALNQP